MFGRPAGPDGLTKQSHLLGWVPSRRGEQLRYEDALNSSVTARSIAAFHELFTTLPHHAGSQGDQAMVVILTAAFEELGIMVEKQSIWPYLSEPIDAAVDIVSVQGMKPDSGYPLSLSLKETALRADPATSHPQLPIGWSAYSGSGDVTGRVVYANQGTTEDFALLKEMGVEVEGKIVMVRTGGIFRGIKAKNAQYAGAAAMLMYPDPADVGYGKGRSYPDGGWANGDSIERGTVLWIDQPGDPRTPGHEARQWTRRKNLGEIDLPKILVQPMGWNQASKILSRMNGANAPESWQGQLPFTYRMNGGADLKVRVKVEQKRASTMVTNVLGIIPGSVYPDQRIVIGCHYDAWTFGAGDPHAGTIVLYEVARAFADAAKSGKQPDRTIVFANWAAEEFGIVGSTEYVEANEAMLGASTVAYINLDMAAMGPNLRMSVSPTLRSIAAGAAQSVPQAGGEADQTAYDLWSQHGTKEPFGDLGGGSDHVPFVGRLCVPVISIAAGGSDGSSYHTAYDTLTWYRKVVGADYQPAIMLSRIVNVLAARLSNADLLPFNPEAHVKYTLAAINSIEAEAQRKALTTDFRSLKQQINVFSKSAAAAQSKMTVAIETGRIKRGGLSDRINTVLLEMDRTWMTEDGLPERDWYKNLQVSPNPLTGYGAWALPALQRAVTLGDQEALDVATEQYIKVFQDLGDLVYKLTSLISRWDTR